MNKIKDTKKHLEVLLNIFEARETENNYTKNLVTELKKMKKDLNEIVETYSLNLDYLVPFELDANVHNQGINFIVPIANKIRKIHVPSYKE